MRCECCWQHRFDGYGMREYHDVLVDHQERGCVCSQNTPEGAKARAGEYWDKTLQRDSREEPTR